MKIKIYQIDPKMDTDRKRFEGLDSFETTNSPSKRFFEIDERGCVYPLSKFVGGIAPCGGEVVYAVTKSEAQELYFRYRNGEHSLKSDLWVSGEANAFHNVIHGASSGKETLPLVDSSIYALVFAGEVNATTMENLFTTLNVRHPRHYYGRSLSVSDVVEVVESTKRVEAGFYFCDVFGFKKIQFDPAATVESYIRVIIADPGKDPVAAFIPKDLKVYQDVVDGWIQMVMPWQERTVCLVCNDDGKCIGLPQNRVVMRGGRCIDILVGTFFLAGLIDTDDGKEIGSIPEDSLDKYLKRIGPTTLRID